MEKKDKECFSAVLFTCYDLVRPDVALELAWRNKYTDNAMPYLVQFMRHLTEKVDVIDERTKPKAEETGAEESNEYNMAYNNGPMMIAATAYNQGGMDMSQQMGGMPGQPQMQPQMPQMGGMGMQMGGGPAY